MLTCTAPQRQACADLEVLLGFKGAHVLERGPLRACKDLKQAQRTVQLRVGQSQALDRVVHVIGQACKVCRISPLLQDGAGRLQGMWV